MSLSQDQFGPIPKTKGQAVRSGIAEGYRNIATVGKELWHEGETGPERAINKAGVVVGALMSPALGAFEGFAQAHENLEDRSARIRIRRDIVQRHYEAGKFET